MKDTVNDRHIKYSPKEDQSSSSDDIRDESPAAISDKYAQDWTASEEKKLVFKLDAIIMTILTLAFFCMQMDRGNIGNALNNNFLEDVGIKQAQYNIGQQLLYVGIVILEVSFVLHVTYQRTIDDCHIRSQATWFYTALVHGGGSEARLSHGKGLFFANLPAT